MTRLALDRTMPYLRWHKTHRRVRYELTGSGAPAMPAGELFGSHRPVCLDVRGPYGDPLVIGELARLYNVAPEQVLPVPGTSSANFVALAAATHPGDLVLVEQPLYDPLSRVASFLRLQTRPLIREPFADFEVSPESLRQALKEHVTAVVLTNLHNPSGRRITREDMRRIVECCVDYDARLIVDEVYLDAAHICLNEPRWTAAALGENVLVTSSLTKVYGLGGLRAGWLMASPGLIERARDVVDLLHADNPAPVGDLTEHALSRIHWLEERYRNHHQAARTIFTRWLDREPRVTAYPSFGAMFECLRLAGGLPGHVLNEHLAAHADTQVVPGCFFALDDHIRVGLGVPPDILEEGLARISSTLTDLL